MTCAPTHFGAARARRAPLPRAADSGWPVYLGDAGATRYSPLLTAVLGTTGLRGATGTITINPTSGNRRNAPMFILKVNRSGDFVIRT